MSNCTEPQASGQERPVFECQDCHLEYWDVYGDTPDYCTGCQYELNAESRKREQSIRDRGESRLSRVAEMAPDALEMIQRLYDEAQNLFTRDGYIYLLGGGGYYKIGRTTNVNRRMRQLEIQLPWRVELLHTIPCEDHRKSERRLHEDFADKRSNGEWFALEEDDLACIYAISRMRGGNIEVYE